jgi:phosphate transport system permease protein
MNNSRANDLKATQYSQETIDIVKQGLTKRYRAERRFRQLGIAAIVISLLFLAVLFISIAANGYTAFWQTFLQLDVYFDPEIFNQGDLKTADYPGLVKKSLHRQFPEVKGRKDKRALYGIVSNGANFRLRNMVLKDPGVVGKTLPVWVPADDDVDMLIKGFLGSGDNKGQGRLSDKQVEWIDHLEETGKLKKKFNTVFFYFR